MTLFQKKYLSNSQRGIGLLELLLSLSIIAVMVMLATRYFQSTSDAQRVTQATEQIQMVSEAAAKWVVGQYNYKSGPNGDNPISIKTLVHMQYLPTSLLDGSTMNPWGGALNIAPYAVNPNNLQFTLDNIPMKSCALLTSRLADRHVRGSPFGCKAGQDDERAVFVVVL